MRCILSTLFQVVFTLFCVAQDRARPNFAPESIDLDTMYIHFQQNFENDRVVLFANGVKIYDGILYSSITMGTTKKVIELSCLTDTIIFTYIFFEKDHYWSTDGESFFFDSKKIEFKVVPSEQGKYLGLFVYWDHDLGSYFDKKSQKTINMFPAYVLSLKPFIYD